ncbi:protein phosphatase 2C domain-containing protein [Cellulomonas oligotrophica]|uniref:Serine/threonine protein phosphatase PrpC n=1 Tax=Cellulomonas oligotrophica TaxID=931536 RepID=A0A7Y9FET1_9CELL|nr:protein phosphatase 2C domain-containing protein [Cellulomonas oligotrophica]NYD86004.1 serine/threonine protein phosphatase PrpC [Cellulomonas oligotrophica]
MVAVVTVTACPACGEGAGPGARFCEACGAPLSAPAAAAAPTAPDGAPAVDAGDATGTAGCTACGGAVAPDGYCLECGTRAPSARDRYEERAAPHVAAVTDVGVRRRRNEDALALGVVDDVSVLVVCDGVGSAPDSDRAALAAARAARDVLVTGVEAAPAPEPDPDAWSRLLVLAGEAADGAVRDAVADAATREDPPSCTFVAALASPGLVVAGWLGDSRAYWLPDDGTPAQLTVDDSLAAERVAAGMSREEAESARDAHAITRWLGVDAPTTTARTVAVRPAGPGWVLACSDGLWNYASAPEVVADQLRAAVGRVGPDPAALARDLVAWANAQGGHDNVTVALARLDRTAPGSLPGGPPTP